MEQATSLALYLLNDRSPWSYMRKTVSLGLCIKLLVDRIKELEEENVCISEDAK